MDYYFNPLLLNSNKYNHPHLKRLRGATEKLAQIVIHGLKNMFIT